MNPTLLHAPPKKQHGVVLITALVLLVAVTLLSLAGMSSTTLEFLMASNQQSRVNSFQQAEAGIDAVIVDQNNFQVSGLTGAGRCTTGFHDTDKYYHDDNVACGSGTVSVPDVFSLDRSRAAVERIPPLLQPAPRFIETSAEKLKVATFKIDSRYDAREIRGGRAEHNQGFIVTVLTPTEELVVRGDDFDAN